MPELRMSLRVIAITPPLISSSRIVPLQLQPHCVVEHLFAIYSFRGRGRPKLEYRAAAHRPPWARTAALLVARRVDMGSNYLLTVPCMYLHVPGLLPGPLGVVGVEVFLI